jgi:hypothetical protein
MHRDSRGYLYRSQRVGDSVKHEYLGAGVLADLAERWAEEERQEREQREAEIRAQLDDLAVLETRVKGQATVSRMLVQACLLEMGCYQHRRQWRMGRKQKDDTAVSAPRPLPESDDPLTWGAAGIRAVLDRARAGDHSVMPKLRILLRPSGNGNGCGERYIRSQATIVREALAKRMSGKSLLVRESFIVQAETMAAEIAGPGATVVERLLADQIATSHLHLTLMELLNCDNSQGDIRVVLAYQRLLTLAQKRYLAAVNMLARVRKLPGASLQINIGDQQVNVSGAPTGFPRVAANAPKTRED